MTPYHLGALAIAAVMVLACSHSNHCTSDSMDKVIEMAKMIAVGVLGNAGIAHALKRGAKKKDGSGEPR